MAKNWIINRNKRRLFRAAEDKQGRIYFFVSTLENLFAQFVRRNGECGFELLTSMEPRCEAPDSNSEKDDPKAKHEFATSYNTTYKREHTPKLGDFSVVFNCVNPYNRYANSVDRPIPTADRMIHPTQSLWPDFGEIEKWGLRLKQRIYVYSYVLDDTSCDLTATDDDMCPYN